MKFIGIYKRGNRLVEGQKYTCILTSDQIKVGKATVGVVKMKDELFTELDFDKCYFLIKVKYTDTTKFKLAHPESQFVGHSPDMPLWNYYKIHFPIGEWYEPS